MQTDGVHFADYDTRLSAYAAVVDSGQILLTWYNGAEPQWTLPGGGVEFDESLDEAVAREVWEETGYHVRVGRPLTTWCFTSDHGPRPPRPYKSVRIVFSATITAGQLGTVERNGTTDFARWIPIDTVPALEPRAQIIDVAIRVLDRAD